MPIIETANTVFPQFFHYDSQGCPEDLDLTDVSDDDSEHRAKYSSKTDQDVAVFMEIAKKLPVRSLVHLLQGHLQAQAGDRYLEFTNEIAQSTARRDEEKQLMQGKGVKKIKKFRFAEIRNSEIRCVVRQIEDLKHVKELWWSDAEMMKMRTEAIEAVKFYRKHRPDYTGAVETMATVGSDTKLVEASLKKLTEDSFARGLEAHIVSLLSRARTATVRAVLEEQKECRMCKDSYELTCESLRGQSLAYSQANRIFASKMAECDQIEALKAVLGKWTPDASA